VKMINMFGAIILWPQNKTDRMLIECTKHETKAREISMTARNKRGILFCEYVKDSDHEFQPWSAGSKWSALSSN